MIDTVTVRLTNRRTEEQKEIPGAQNRHSNRLTDKKKDTKTIQEGMTDTQTRRKRKKLPCYTVTAFLPALRTAFPKAHSLARRVVLQAQFRKRKIWQLQTLNGERPAADGEAPAPPRCYNKTYNFPCGPVNQLYKQYWPVITILDLEINQFVTELRER